MQSAVSKGLHVQPIETKSNNFVRLVQGMKTSLYKYFPDDDDKLERFVNGSVYLTPPKYFNDPWDFRLRSEPWTKELVKKEIGNALSLVEFDEFYSKEASTAGFLEDEASEQQTGLSELIGIICLTEYALNRLMWANYGNSHKGFVAEFRCTRFRLLEENGHSLPICTSPFGETDAVKVQYLSENPDLKRDKSNIEDVVRTKHNHWGFENEWRVIESLNKATHHPKKIGFHLLWFKPADLLRVIVGLQASNNVKFQLRQMLNHVEYSHVLKEESFINPETRNLDTRPLPW